MISTDVFIFFTVFAFEPRAYPACPWVCPTGDQLIVLADSPRSSPSTPSLASRSALAASLLS